MSQYQPPNTPQRSEGQPGEDAPVSSTESLLMDGMYRTRLRERHGRGRRWQRFYLAANILAVVALVILFMTILNRAFGLLVVTYAVHPSTLSDRPLEELTEEELIAILERIGEGRLRVLVRNNLIGRFIEPVRLFGLPLNELLPGHDIFRRIRDKRYPALDAGERARLFSDLTGTAISADQLATQPLGDVLAGQPIRAAIADRRLDELTLEEVGLLLTDLTGISVDVIAFAGSALPELMPNRIIRPEMSADHFYELTISDMAALLSDNLSQAQVYEMIIRDVCQPNYVASWTLSQSILNRPEIEAFVAQEYPEADLVFKNWLTPDFVGREMGSQPATAGLRTALVGSLWIIALTILFSLPLGVGAAIYLEEYAEHGWLNNLIETNIRNLAGVPSIIYGMLGLAVFVRALGQYTSGAFLGIPESNGRTVISAALTMTLLILPVVIINAQEAIRAVPSSIREASYGVGATRWQTVSRQVLPAAFPGILTGMILSVSRAVGETAPLIVVGGLTFMTIDPNGPFSKFSVIPIQIYDWTARPEETFRNIAAAAIIVLLITLLSLNALAILLRQRFSKRLRG